MVLLEGNRSLQLSQRNKTAHIKKLPDTAGNRGCTVQIYSLKSHGTLSWWNPVSENSTKPWAFS